MKKRVLSLFVVVAMLMTCIPVAFASDEEAVSLTTEFNQDFEAYDVDLIWSDVTNADINRNYISNGATAKAAYAADNMTIAQGPLTINGSNDYAIVDGTTLHTGGLDGYVGISAGYGFMGKYYVTTENDASVYPGEGGRGKVPNLFVLDDGDDGNNALYTVLQHIQGSNHSWFGKEKLDLYGKKNKLTFSYKNIGTADNLTTLTITKYTAGWKDVLNTLAGNTTASALHTKNQSGIKQPEANEVQATDAVIIYNGAAYLSSAYDNTTQTLDEEGKICDVSSVGVYYTIDVYLDYMTDTTVPMVTVAVKDEDGNVIGLKSGNLPVSSKEGETTIANANKDKGGIITLNPFLIKQAKFTHYSSGNAGYGAYITFNTTTGNAAMYIDDFAMSAYTDADIPTTVVVPGRQFVQDFEASEYDADIVWKEFYNAASNNWAGGKRYYVSNGATAKAALAANNVTLAEGDLYTDMYDANGVLKAPAAGFGANSTIDSATMAGLADCYKNTPTYKGGLEDYVGIAAATGYMPQIYMAKPPYFDRNSTRGMIPNLFVVDDGEDNKALYTEITAEQGNNSAWFGKEGLNLYGYRTKLSFDFKSLDKSIMNGLTTLTITKNTSKWKDILESYADTKLNGHTKNLPGFRADVQVTDAVVINNGKVYIGNGLGSDYNMDESKYICDVNKAGVYYTIDAYLDYSFDDDEIPFITVVVKDENGKVIGFKSGELPIASAAGITSVNALGKTGAVPTYNQLLCADGNNTAAYFTNQAASGYGAYITSSIGTNPGLAKCTYFDNFTMEEYEEINLPDYCVTASIDVASKTANVNICSLYNVTGKALVCEYNSATKKLIQAAFADVTGNGPVDVVFDYALTPGSEYTVHLWKNFETIQPIIRAFVPDIAE